MFCCRSFSAELWITFLQCRRSIIRFILDLSNLSLLNFSLVSVHCSLHLLRKPQAFLHLEREPIWQMQLVCFNQIKSYSFSLLPHIEMVGVRSSSMHTLFFFWLVRLVSNWTYCFFCINILYGTPKFFVLQQRRWNNKNNSILESLAHAQCSKYEASQQCWWRV